MTRISSHIFHNIFFYYPINNCKAESICIRLQSAEGKMLKGGLGKRIVQARIQKLPGKSSCMQAAIEQATRIAQAFKAKAEPTLILP